MAENDSADTADSPVRAEQGGRPYVALGDSYAAGIGAGHRTGRGWRTDAGYPVAVARSLGLDLCFQAVLGATSTDVTRDQLPSVGAGTELVTVTIGGNDAGFTPVIVAAAEPAWLSQLDDALRAADRVIHDELPDRLDRLFTSVHGQAPEAALVVTGYPQLFDGRDCSPFTFFSASDMTKLNDSDLELDGVIRAAVKEAGASFVDVRAEFRGHAVCADDAWLHDLTWPLQNSFHPTEQGHRTYADLVLAGVAAARGATAGRNSPAADVEIEHGSSKRGSAPTFLPRDLLTGRSRPARLIRADRRARGEG